MNAISLQEYRLSCPAAAFPTITQSGLIGPILARRQRRTLRKMRRRARLDRVLNLPVKATLRLLNLFATLFQRGVITISTSHLTPENKTP
jgi:hypothetical protein